MNQPICYSYVYVKKILNYIIYFFAVIGFVLTLGFFAVKYGFTREEGVIDTQRNTFVEEPTIIERVTQVTQPPQEQSWEKTEEWAALRDAIIKDKEDITRAARAFNINPRLIVAIITVEQLRLFSDDRELFKKVFAPLKILGVQSQFSWGVVGIKRETAMLIEQHLTDESSPFYPGKGYESLLNFSTENHEDERFMRLTDQHNRYYSYLYTAAYIKEITHQWDSAGYLIDDKPDIIATLFNIGFAKSKPNPTPSSGGASITLDGISYSFGSLAQRFYASNELLTQFPQ